MKIKFKTRSLSSITVCPFCVKYIDIDVSRLHKDLHNKANKNKVVHTGSWLCQLCLCHKETTNKYVICNHN